MCHALCLTSSKNFSRKATIELRNWNRICNSTHNRSHNRQLLSLFILYHNPMIHRVMAISKINQRAISVFLIFRELITFEKEMKTLCFNTDKLQPSNSVLSVPISKKYRSMLIFIKRLSKSPGPSKEIYFFPID